MIFSSNMPMILRHRYSRWLLALLVCWQGMIGFMPIAQAKVAAGDGGWISICTLHGSAKVWVAGDKDSSKDSHAKSDGQCVLCLMSHNGIAPPIDFNFKTHQSLEAEVGQVAFTAVFLTRAWAEPATGPPLKI